MRTARLLAMLLAALIAAWLALELVREREMSTAAQVEPDGAVVRLRGPIDAGSVRAVRSALADAGAEVVELSSLGGNARAGFDLADALEGRHVRVVGVCASACAVGAVAAGRLEIEGALAFHAAWSPEYPAGVSLAGIVSNAHAMTVRADAHLARHGFHRGAYLDILDLTSPSMFLVARSSEDLARARKDIRSLPRVPGAVLTAAYTAR